MMCSEVSGSEEAWLFGRGDFFLLATAEQSDT